MEYITLINFSLLTIYNVYSAFKNVEKNIKKTILHVFLADVSFAIVVYYVTKL